MLAHMLLQVNRGLHLLVSVCGSKKGEKKKKKKKDTAIYFLAASEDNGLHLGLKDSEFAFNKWSKLE